MNRPTIEIFSQGDEVLTGQVVDTNAAWLASRVTDMGFQVIRHSAVGDNLGDLKALLQEIAARADCCLCTGGLGPTVDDLTAQAVSEAFDRPLRMDEEAVAQIQQYFDRRQRPMAESNRKQALLPRGSQRLDNLCGTAPGFALREQQCRFFFMPGVPAEMKQMFERVIVPELRQSFELHTDTRMILRVAGMGESDIQQQLDGFPLPENVKLGFRTTDEDIEVKLGFPVAMETRRCKAITAQLADVLGDAVYCIETASDSTSLPEWIAKTLAQQKLELSLLETVTYGAIAARFAEVSVRLHGQVMPVNNQQDTDLLTLARRLATHLPNQIQLIQSYHPGQQRLLNYVAGPSGERYSEHTLSGLPIQKQQRATRLALNFLRLYLQTLCR